ncbi:2-aminoethylphosphonate ABC transporter permease subunit [Streptomyces sp. NBC_01551]|uniref:2-aminoethylphosphonate ABC transporter permease subunit n=1 Tax=Streptomyces sp. NBC_01551 TaxID=2975876 RepID=UPI00224E571B|nr:2-aminoethylphosphonate ABC transporter permease subunit [Streptomyces sp. NBC_01551]MCX4526029.1 2-aminoethylphosphonate ABC transporter permease subunit [Streptomyces sp. NBC_01551]
MAEAPRLDGRRTAHLPGTRTPEHTDATPDTPTRTAHATAGGTLADHGTTAGSATTAPGHTATPSGSRTPHRIRPPQGTGVPRWLWSVPPVAVLALVFLYPLALVVQQSFTPENGGGAFDAYASVFASHGFREALGTTVWLAVGATVGCLVLGFALALIIAFVPFPGAKAVAKFIDVFLSFPSFLITLALLFIYGTVGMANGVWTDLTGAADGPFHFLTTPWGVLLAEITYFTPFVMRPLLAAFSQLDTAQLEVASSLGAKPARIIRRVILPEALPALAAGGSLVLVMCLNEFGIVLFTGAKDVTTLPMLIYGKAILESDYAAACVVAVVNIAISVGLFGLYRVVSKRAGA